MFENKPIHIKLSTNQSKNHIYLSEKKSDMSKLGLNDWEISEIKIAEENGGIAVLRSESSTRIIALIDSIESGSEFKSKEAARRAGVKVLAEINKFKFEEVSVSTTIDNSIYLKNLVEGIVLSNYQFLTYKSEKKANPLKEISIMDSSLSQSDVNELSEVLNGVYIARTLVNEPVVTLDAVRFAEEMTNIGKLANFSVKVLDKKAIEAEKMGGLLTVNLGSKIPPTFTIMEHKPANAKNKKPFVIVGKGVVYDTGGLSLKPTAGSMDSMKSDMAGAAAVVGAMYSIAKNNLPIHIIGLVPATDNRPGENAITPGDVITHRGGKTAEILNTDAEGRLILADALDYAKQYDPELVFDLATLTGAQVMAIGQYAAAIMGSASEETKSELKKVGFDTHERVAEMPFWEDYGELIKSDVADIKNVGGREGGCITAGKYLEHFTDYPWIHIDIAGPSFLGSPEFYKPKGGTGYGVRLLYEFFKSKA